MKKSLMYFVIMLLYFYSCQNRTTAPPEKNEFGEVSFKMNMANAPTDVIAIRGFLARANYDTIHFSFTINNDSAYATVNNIVSGQWEITVNAYNVNNIIIYSGSTYVNISPGIITPVYLQLNPVTGTLEIIVTWDSNNPNLLAYYPFNGNANDESGNGNNGNVHGAVLTNDRFNNPNNAYSFDGIDDYIDIQNYQNFNNLNAFTISAWIYPTDFSSYGCIISKVEPNRDFDFKIYSGRLSFEFNSSGSYYVCRMDNQLPLEAWTFVAGTWNGNQLKIYVNGEHIKTSDFTGFSPAWTGTSLQIGQLATIEAFHGKIDELRIYKYEMSATEIFLLFSN